MLARFIVVAGVGLWLAHGEPLSAQSIVVHHPGNHRHTVVEREPDGSWHAYDVYGSPEDIAQARRDGKPLDTEERGREGENWTVNELIHEYADRGSAVELNGSLLTTDFDPIATEPRGNDIDDEPVDQDAAADDSSTPAEPDSNAPSQGDRTREAEPDNRPALPAPGEVTIPADASGEAIEVTTPEDRTAADQATSDHTIEVIDHDADSGSAPQEPSVNPVDEPSASDDRDSQPADDNPAVTPDQADREQLDHEQAERDKASQEQADREQANREQTDRDHAAQEQADRAQADQEQGDREQPDHSAADQDQADHEAMEHDTPDHEEADHDAPDHDAPDHDAPDRDRVDGA